MNEAVTKNPVAPRKSKSYKKPIAIIVTGVLVIAAAITAVTLSSNAAYAAETEQLCTVALKDSKSAHSAALVTTTAADAALIVATNNELPDNAGTSTDYAKRAGAEAIEAVEPVAADGDTAEVKEVQAVPSRPSGAQFIRAITDSRDVLRKFKAATVCGDRDQLMVVEDATANTVKLTATLEEDTEALLADHEVFQKEETARIIAEKKAAEEAAAKAAAEAAAAQAAAEAAAAQAAADAAWQAQQNYSPPSYNGGGGGSSGGGGYSPPPSSGGGGGGGGGQIIIPGGGGGCPPTRPVCFG